MKRMSKEMHGAKAEDMVNHKTYFQDIGIWPSRKGGEASRYIFGFFVSLILTLAAYFVVTEQLFSRFGTVGILVILIGVQFLVQLRYFLHIDFNAGSRQRLMSLCFAMLIVSIITVGSIWIMINLNSRMMLSPEQMNTFMGRNPGI
jgi:cytochrome o ubiquinol oxidase subunit IV